MRQHRPFSGAAVATAQPSMARSVPAGTIERDPMPVNSLIEDPNLQKLRVGGRILAIGSAEDDFVEQVFNTFSVVHPISVICFSRFWTRSRPADDTMPLVNFEKACTIFPGETKPGVVMDLLRQRVKRGYPTLLESSGHKSCYVAIRAVAHASVKEKSRYSKSLIVEETEAIQKHLKEKAGRTFDGETPLDKHPGW